VAGDPKTLRARLERRREAVIVVSITAFVSLLVWTAFLGWDLPRHYDVQHWAVVWVGLDVGEAVMLLATAWAAWRGRVVLVLFAAIAGSFFLLDAWYDVTTAHGGDFRESLLLAVFLEIPAALGLFWLSVRVLRHVSYAWLRASKAADIDRIWRVKMPSLEAVYVELQDDTLERE